MKHFSCQQIIRFRLLITLSITLLTVVGYGQTPKDSLKIQNDSLTPTTDTVKGGFDLETEVFYKAADSIRFDMDSKVIFLYGKAQVTYENNILDAAYMEIDMGQNQVYAKGKTDSTGKYTEKVKFKDGENELDAQEIRYNLKSKKGKVYGVFTTEGEGFVHMGEAKKLNNNEVHLRNGMYTTCSNEKPHYHFRMKKAIVIPDDKIVTGPLYMVLGKVPTPLALPFGYFPNKRGSVRGIVIPQYGASPTYGYYLLNGGYYLPVGNHIDMQFLGDIYSRGSWSLKQLTRYKWKYRFNGAFNASFSKFKIGDRDFPDFSTSNEFFVKWSHNQDPKAKPGYRFTANVNFGTQSNFQNNFNTQAQDYLSGTFASNVSFTRTWIGTPLSLNTSLRHNQNRISKVINVTVPELTFNVNRFFPFASKNKDGVKQWYERVGDNIGITYSANVRNDISAGDSLYSVSNINRLAEKYSRNGIKHNATIGTTFKWFGQRFTFNPSAVLTERWYLQELNKTFTGSEVRTDTTSNFLRNFEYALNASLTTKLYGMYSTKRSGGPKLRHVITPALNFNYRPGYTINQTVQSDTSGNTTTYSKYDLGIFGKPSTQESGALGFSLQNNLELKKRSAKDTVSGYVKIPLIENFTINANYDLIRDSLNLSNISFNARNTFFKVLGVVYSSVLDPYYYENGRITRYYFAQKGRGLGRITTNNLAVNYTFKAKPKKPKKKLNNLTEEERDEAEAIQRNANDYVDFDVPFTLSVGYNLNFSRQYQGTLDTVITTQSVNILTDFSVTRKLKFGINSNYDFVAQKLSYTQIDLYYDLHCWEFKASVIPFGLRKSYTLTLNVKASILQDLRVQRRRSWVDL